VAALTAVLLVALGMAVYLTKKRRPEEVLGAGMVLGKRLEQERCLRRRAGWEENVVDSC
jgi:hypothetical protein